MANPNDNPSLWSVIKNDLGKAEGILTIGSSMAALPASGIAAMPALFSHGVDGYTAAQRSFQDAMTYMPRTKNGQQHLVGALEEIAPITNGIESGLQWLGNTAADSLPENAPQWMKAAAYAGGYTAPEAIASIWGGSGLMRAARRIDPTNIGDVSGLKRLGMGNQLGAVGTTKRVGSTGKYVGAPAGIDTPQKLGAIRKSYGQTAEAGAHGRNWYNDSSNFIDSVTPDVATSQKMADALAITSGGTPVDANLGYTVKAFNQHAAGAPVHTSRFPNQNRGVMEAVLDGQRPNLGNKRQPFGDNLSVGWNPALTNRPVHDIWQGRAMGFKNPNGTPWDGGFSPAQHQFMDNQTQMVSNKLNANNAGGFNDWDNLKTQAAAWTGEKIKAGDIRPEDAAKHYGNYADKYAANATHEAIPGQGMGHMEGFADLPLDVREAYTSHPNSLWLNNKGQDLLYSEAGMLTQPSRSATGIFTPKSTGKLEINPAHVGRPLVAMDGPSGARMVDDSSRNMLNSIESTRAYIDAQNAGAWHKPIFGNKAGASNSMFLETDKISPEQMISLQGVGNRNGMFPIDTGKGVTLMNDPWTDAGAARTGNALLKEMKGDLGGEVNSIVPASNASRTQVDSGYLDFEDAWKQGDGAATRQLFKQLDVTPGLIDKLDGSPAIRQKVLANMDRDIKFGGAHNTPPREDIMNARKIIAEKGLAGLKKALESGVVLPAAAAITFDYYRQSSGLSGEQQL